MTGSRRRWVYALVAGWAAALAAMAFVPVAGSDATVLEHRSPVQAQPLVDRGVAAAVDAAGRGVAVTVTGYQLRRRCDVAQFREGGDFARIAYLHTRPGNEKALLQRLADEFGKRYDVRGPTRDGSFIIALTEFVVLRAAPRVDDTASVPGKGTGVVQVTVSTGCRPIDEPVATFHPAAGDGDRDRLAPALHSLNMTGDTWTTHHVACADGDIRTVEVTAPATSDTPELAKVADELATDQQVLIRQPSLLAYRDGDTSLVIRRTGDTVTVMSTVDCAG